MVQDLSVVKISMVHMGMLRWMNRDRIRNEVIRTKVGMTILEEKIRESRLI